MLLNNPNIKNVVFDEDLYMSCNPKIYIKEDNLSFYIYIKAPNVRKEDIKINISESFIKIRGGVKLESEYKTNEYNKIKTSYCSFEKVFGVPKNVDFKKITASQTSNGLEVVIPKTKTLKIV